MSDQIVQVATRARDAAVVLALATRSTKDAALEAMAQALLDRTEEILSANAEDVDAAEDAGTAAHLIDRLRLDSARVAGMAQGLRDVAGLPDPVGEVLRGGILANGLELRQVRVPFGVCCAAPRARCGPTRRSSACSATRWTAPGCLATASRWSRGRATTRSRRSCARVAWSTC
jgi:glutamate-5-semialdehyde dehydrogenase